MRACPWFISCICWPLCHRSQYFLISHLRTPTIAIGKYRVSAMPRRLEDGRYGAGVSIRSGQGSASTDRVLRFIGQFDTEAAANRHAHEQGALWVAQRNGAFSLC
jgi:hypothetical protein